MPSGKFNAGTPPTPSNKKGISRAWLAAASSGNRMRKLVVYSRPEVGWHLHPGQDKFCLGIFLLSAIDNRLQVELGFGDREATETGHLHPVLGRGQQAGVATPSRYDAARQQWFRR